MSIEQYRRLADNSDKNLGVQLPDLTAAGLSIESRQGSFDDVKQAINQLQPTDGWVMFRDEVVISANRPHRTDVIEAEYANGSRSLMIKLLHGSTYQLTNLEKQGDNSDYYCFCVQAICVRNALKDVAGTAQYRLWYQQIDHRWQPVAQQLIGFTKEESK